MDAELTRSEIAVSTALLKQIGAAILALADPTVSAYTLDTGQSVQRVTREHLPDLYKQRKALQDEISTLTARLTGCGVTHVGPAW